MAVSPTAVRARRGRRCVRVERVENLQASGGGGGGVQPTTTIRVDKWVPSEEGGSGLE